MVYFFIYFGFVYFKFRGETFFAEKFLRVAVNKSAVYCHLIA